jgi:homogentisate 1,2-dioxygenase
MPFYRRVGEVPRKRHTAFRSPAGSLYAEELVGSRGFSGPSSLLYHLRPPSAATSFRKLRDLRLEAAADRGLAPLHLRAAGLTSGPSATLDRVPLLFNDDATISMVRPAKEDEFFYRNGGADELLYVGEGRGVLESPMGDLPFGPGDYVVVPRGILTRLRLGEGPHRLLVVESRGSVRIPARYRNEHGQLLESSPYCERDLRGPSPRPPRDEPGEFRALVKDGGRLSECVLGHHPFDVVGWDGCYYPWAFNILDFEPRVGRVHLPPPVHQTFEGDGFVVCSFCPRPYDFDPQAIPAPYHHSNVMSDEVLYYVRGEFTSRKGIEAGSITLHPAGLPHGPQPGRAEASIGKKETDELAVMVDTFRPLVVAREAAALEDPAYPESWSRLS